MKNFVLNLRKMIGDENSNGYFTEVPTSDSTIYVPNFLAKYQEDVYPKIVIKPFISFLPTVKGEIENTPIIYTTHEGRVQIDIFAKSQEQVIYISMAVNQRLIEFFNDLEVIPYNDVFDWEPYYVDENILVPNVYLNQSYLPNQGIFRVYGLTKKSTLQEMLSTNKTWFLGENGLYLHHGDWSLDTNDNVVIPSNDNKEILELQNGRIFDDGMTAQEKGFIGINYKNPMRELDGEEVETHRFSLDYDLLYNSYRTMNEGDVVNTIKMIEEPGNNDR